MTDSVVGHAAPVRPLRRLQLTMGVQCNVRCTMCYQTEFGPKHDMPAAIYRDRLRDAYGHIERLKVTGGEPTFLRNCREVAAIVRAYPNVKLDIHTNGVRVDEFWHESFVEQGGLVFFSINAATQQTYDRIVIGGNHRKVIANIERLVAARKGTTPSVGISAVILKENVFEIAKLIRLAASLRVDLVVFMMDPILSRAGTPPRGELRAELQRAREAQQETGMAVHGLDKFERAFCPSPGADAPPIWELEAIKPCAKPFTELVVDPGGDVRVCCNTWVSVGSIYESDFAALRAGQGVAAFQRRVCHGNYLWCDPYCRDNPRPHRLAIAHKLWTYVREDPQRAVRKLARKVRQVRGERRTARH